MKKINLALMLVIAGISGCYTSSNTYQSEKTKGVDFKKYKTFAWLPTKDTAYTKLVDKKLVDQALAADVMQELTKRGMKLDTLNPDCLFTYTLVMNKTYQVGQGPNEVYTPVAYAPYYNGQNTVYYYRDSYGLPTFSGKMMVTTFRDGSLIIDMIDRQDDKVIWRASAEGKTDEQNAKGVRATAREVIPKMFKKFPIKHI